MLTLQRLAEMPVGGKMTAYVGNLPYDIARCERTSPGDAGAPKYKQLLMHLDDFLGQLERSGVVKVTMTEIRRQRMSSRGTANDWREYSYEVEKLR